MKAVRLSLPILSALFSFLFILLISFSSDRYVGIYKEIVELTFVYLIEGCGKTSFEINDTIPHTRIDMGYGYAERDLPQVSIRSECCSVPSFQLENFHIFDKGLAKKRFHKYVKSKRLNRLTLQIKEKLFINGQHSQGYCIRQEKTKEIGFSRSLHSTSLLSLILSTVTIGQSMAIGA